MNEQLLQLARDLSSAPVLVTGASGRVGIRLVEVLAAAGCSVRAMSRKQCASIAPGAESCMADLTTGDGLATAVEGVGWVFHLASYAPAPTDRDPENNPLHQEVAIEGTGNLLNQATQAGVDALVLTSSTRVIDGSNSCYARAKRQAEALVNSASPRIKTTVLRLSPVYGFAHQGSIAQMLAAIAAGRFPPLPDFGDRRSLVHVDDVVQALLLAALSPEAAGKTYTVTDLQNYSSRQIYELICEALGRTPPGWHVPAWLLWAGAGAGSLLENLTGRPMPLNRARLNSLARSACFDAQEIVEDLAFSPVHTLEEALPEIVRQFRFRA